MVDATDALERLKRGNVRFASGSSDRDPLTSSRKRGEAVDGQQPFAVVLGCSDSRVPVEMVFDQDLGDLFVIRVAGHVVAPSQIGSVEYAAEKFGTSLVVVLGHSQCGAVRAAVEELQRPSADQSPHLKAIVDRIRPAVGEIVSENPGDDTGALVDKAVRANIHHAVEALRHGSQIIESRIRSDGLSVIGAEYSLESGLVEFFEIQ
ncbi:MAG: carbonic anhydrase [Gammaproteobacteria bacterium]|nr:carbonic anhydrase [Gammaproteobacteria bacterium]